MRKKTIQRFLFIWITLCFSGLGVAQPRGPLVISPLVNPDNTVVFRYPAPSAKEIKLSMQFEKVPIVMMKDPKGTWSVTVGPIKPDIYPYSFVADGVTVYKLINPQKQILEES